MGLKIFMADSLPRPVVRLLRAIKRRLLGVPAIGRVDFGDLRRLAPMSGASGYDRGQPVDRYYIERFLEKHANDVRGRVLEIGSNAYTLKYGGTRVTVSDVLHVTDESPRATIVGDLAEAPHIEDETFDTIILTQTLIYIFDLRAAVATLNRILKPGGVLLVTVPGICPMPLRGGWESTWSWSFTAYSLRRLLAERFDPTRVHVAAHGNLLAAIAMLEGIAAGELEQEELDSDGPDYPVIVTGRAVKSSATAS